MDAIYKKYLTKLALVWVSCFVLFFIVHILVMVPQKKAKQQIEKQLAEQKRIYNSAMEATQPGTKAVLNEKIENLRNKLRDFAIDFEDSANLTFDISQIANAEKVDSFSVKAQNNRKNSTSSDSKYIGENRVEVSFSGGFNQFAAVLNALERHRPVIFVDRFKITRSSKDSSSHRANMNLTFLVRKQQSG